MTDSGAHLSIGEVLSLVQEDFPDVTISKIRFLESQGLIDPERTPSGYRKFYEPDIVRLRWILRQQRDHFLPLKVIKAKLEQSSTLDFDDDAPAQPNLWSTTDGGDLTEAGAEPVAPTDVPSSAPSSTTAPASSGATPAPVAPTTTAGTSRGRSSKEPADAAAWLAALQEAPKRHASAGLGKRTASPISPSGGSNEPDEASTGRSSADNGGIRFGIAEVAEVTGVSVVAIRELIEFGLVAPVMVGGESTFDATSVAVVRACAKFAGHGVSGRHLRIYKNAADREAGFYEQLILPLLKQRNPKSHERAVESLEQLVDAGEALHQALLRQALRSHF